MKKILIPVLFLSFVIGIYATAGAEMTYGPLVIDDASVLPKKTFEVIGFYSHASPTIEFENPQGTVMGEVDLPISGLNGAVSYGLTDNIELGLSLGSVSRDYIVSMSTASGSLKIETDGVSGNRDIMAKAKIGNGKVAGSIVLFLPTGKEATDDKEGISVKDNDMDIALKFVWTPIVDKTGGIHLNLGYTSWGKDDALDKNGKEQTSSIDYGIGLEFFLGRYDKSASLTIEFAGNTLEDIKGDTPMDVYSGMRINVSKEIQITGLLALGVSDGSVLGKWELGYGLGLKWVGNIF